MIRVFEDKVEAENRASKMPLGVLRRYRYPSGSQLIQSTLENAPSRRSFFAPSNQRCSAPHHSRPGSQLTRRVRVSLDVLGLANGGRGYVRRRKVVRSE